MSQLPGVTVGGLLGSRTEAFGLTIELLAGNAGTDRLITLASQPAMVALEVVMAIPGLAFAVPDLNKAHAAFHQAPRD